MAKQGEKGISWCDETVNPIRARFNGRIGHYCERVSAGCANCYSSRMQRRFGMPAFKGEAGAWLNDVIEPFLDESKLELVLKRRKPTRFFWGDMTDLFGSWVKNEWLDRCFAVMALTPQHAHMVLTKRVERMLAYMLELLDPERLRRWMNLAADGEPHRYGHYNLTSIARLARKEPQTKRTQLLPPFDNVLLGTTVENQQMANERRKPMDRLARMGWITFVSAEPLLGPLNLHLARPCDRMCSEYQNAECPGVNGLCAGEWKLDWVICGGETGPGARPMHPDWVRGLRDQCQAAGVPFHFKQWGEWLRLNDEARDLLGDDDPAISDSQDRQQYKTQLTRLGNETFVRVGKKAAGRMLDGREWLEFPEDFKVRKALP